MRRQFYLLAVTTPAFLLSAILVLYVNLGCSSFKKEGYITPERAWHIIRIKIVGGETSSKVVYLYSHLMGPGEKFRTWKDVYTVPKGFYNSWLFFIDDQPGANWEHKCRYVFVDTVSGRYKIFVSKSPPLSMDGMKKFFP